MNSSANTFQMREQALAIFEYALAECDIARAFARNVQCNDGFLRLGDESYDLSRFSRLAVVSIGKAGHSMAEALH